MLNYIKRVFSWKGYSGRREFLGFYILPFGVVSLFIILPLLLITWWDKPVSGWFKLWCLIVGLGLTVVDVCAWARRLRHLGWPIWLAFLQIIPFVQSLIYLAGLVLVFQRSQKEVIEERPTYLLPNLSIGVGGFLLPILLLFGMIVLVKTNPGLYLKLLPQKQQEEIQQKRLQKQLLFPVLPSEEPRERLHSLSKPSLLSRGPLTCAQPSPTSMPAPKAVAIADSIPWQSPVACEDLCLQHGPNTQFCLKSDLSKEEEESCARSIRKFCRQYNSPNEKAHLCVFRVPMMASAGEYHQILVNPKNQISEYITFYHNKSPKFLGHFKEGQLQELFYRQTGGNVFFFHLTQPGFEPDFTNDEHLPTTQYAKISMLLLSPSSWVPADCQQNGKSTEASPRTLTTPWEGFKVSDKWLKFDKI